MRPEVTRYSVKPSTPMNASAEDERAVAVAPICSGGARKSMRTRFFSSSGTNDGVPRHVVGRNGRVHVSAVGQRRFERVAVDDDSRDAPRVGVAQQIRERHYDDLDARSGRGR